MSEEIRITSPDEYQAAAVRTLPDYGFEKNVLHCIMGMAGESGEVTELVQLSAPAKALKRVLEAGDCFWYAACLSEVLGIPFSWVDGEAQVVFERGDSEFPTSRTEERIHVWSSRMVDRCKKTIFYGKELDQKALTHELVFYVAALLSYCQKIAVMRHDVWTANIKKLKVRFPEKFDAALAINKNSDAEQVAAGV